MKWLYSPINTSSNIQLQRIAWTPSTCSLYQRSTFPSSVTPRWDTLISSKLGPPIIHIFIQCRIFIKKVSKTSGLFPPDHLSGLPTFAWILTLGGSGGAGWPTCLWIHSRNLRQMEFRWYCCWAMGFINSTDTWFPVKPACVWLSSDRSIGEGQVARYRYQMSWHHLHNTSLQVGHYQEAHHWGFHHQGDYYLGNLCLGDLSLSSPLSSALRLLRCGCQYRRWSFHSNFHLHLLHLHLLLRYLSLCYHLEVDHLVIREAGFLSGMTEVWLECWGVGLCLTVIRFWLVLIPRDWVEWGCIAREDLQGVGFDSTDIDPTGTSNPNGVVAVLQGTSCLRVDLWSPTLYLGQQFVTNLDGFSLRPLVVADLCCHSWWGWSTS